MPVHDEESFEAAIVAELCAAGWHQGASGSYDRGLGIDTGELAIFLGATQAEQFARLTRYYGSQEEAQQGFARRLAEALTTRGTLDVLRRGVKDHGVQIRLAYFAPAHSITPQLQQLYAGNRLTVTRQLRYSPTTTGELDLALFVNGVPVATAELKNRFTGQDVAHAKHQYRADRDPRELLFAKRALVHFAVDQDLVFLTTRLAGADTRFLPFNVGTSGPGVAGGAGNPAATSADAYRTSYLWRDVWQPDAWLDLLARFVHAARGELIFPRLHQWHAVRALTADVAEHDEGRNYLVMHSAGSGKSNTIAWLAHRLASLHDAGNRKRFAKVVVVTDRLVLDRQLQDTIFQFDHVPGVVQRIDGGSRQLAEALAGETAQVIVTTLQKFPYAMAHMTSLTGTRFAVIVDEAHSSQTGETAKALKQVLSATGSTAAPVDPEPVDPEPVDPETAALDAAAAADAAVEALVADNDLLTDSAIARGRHDNLSFFAFTATPKTRTLELFGTQDTVGGPYRPFHTYSMRQAIEEGFILDVLRSYVTYATYYRLANANPDDPDLDVRNASAQLARFASLHPSNMDQRAQVIVEHFRAHTRPRLGGRAKAMVVTRSRLHAVRTFEAIRAYVARKGYTDCHPLVAFSGTVDDGGVANTEALLNGFGEAALPERFAYTLADDPHAGTPSARQPFEYAVLVVAEKYQTGIDQPLLTTMYVDKRLDGVKAVQTLSRLNRTHPLKSQDDIFVLDFANDVDDIQAAFEPYYETSIAEPTDPHLLYGLQTRVLAAQIVDEAEMDAFVAAYLAAPAEPSTRSGRNTRQRAHAALYRFTDPARERFAALLERDPGAAEEFRSTLLSYTRAYAFLAAVMAWHDPDLERLHLFGKHLLLGLARRSDPAVDVGSIDLTHLRLVHTGDDDASLQPAGDQVLPGFTGGGLGALGERELRALSEIIEALNDKLGHELTEADQLVIEQHVVTATRDDELQAAAWANTLENYGYVFDKRFETLMLDRHEANADLIRRFLDDPQVTEVFTSWARQESYRRIRDHDGQAS